ncbi:MAG TPA: TonB-dependent receptor [Rhodothermales bacterium]|nr:TonB-dependent receptor [Rhodothermales bacterium]
MRLLVTPCLGLLLLASLGIGSASAQTGKIAGRVIEASTGDPLPGVNVVIPGTLQGSTSDVEGYYFILNVKPGTYAVRSSFIGYTPVTVDGVRVMIDKTATADFSLNEETIEGEEIVVVARRPLVDKDLTSTATSVSSERLEALPVLTFNDVINLQAGVVEGHFRGGRTGEVSYLVDGIPINDVYDQTYSYQVENNSIQEIEVITGTFNAEYGQAQSGIVNIVTKDGGDSYSGSFSAYGGDYASTGTDLFTKVDDVSPVGTYELQGSLGGPVLGDRVTFFASGRYWHDDGFLYGRRVVQPVTAGPGEGQIVTVDGRQVFVPAFGDSSYTSMNWRDQWTGSIKLSARPRIGTRLTFSLLTQEDEGQDYDHFFKYNPGGTPTTYGTSRSLTASLSHFMSGRSFVEVNAAYFTNAVDSYLYEDPLDPRWPADDAIRSLGGNFSFVRGGARMDYFERKTKTRVVSMDYTSQFTRKHQVKTGFELKSHDLDVDRFEVLNNSSTGFEPAVPPSGTPAHVQISADPVEAGAFIQDKMEFDFMIVNVGLRLDYFDAKGDVLQDFGRPQTSDRSPSDAKWQLSPRVGIAYPLSEAGVVHISYGHFFQMPPFEFLYTNSDYIFDPEEGVGRAFGFADLEPQQTVAYEIGLQQAFSETFGATFTVYFKDIRNLLGTRLEVIQPGFDEPFPLEKYGRYVNRDYGQVRGFTVALEKRMSQGFAFDIDYTFQIAEGNASDPRSVLLDEAQGIEPEKQLVPLDWDRRHQLITSMTVGQPGNWIGTLTGRMGSGLPYTPSLADERIGLENSARRRSTVTFDLYAMKEVGFGGLPLSIFARVFNVLDTRNEINIFSDTGRAFPNLRFQPGEPQGLNTKEEFLQRPDFYSAPRQVTVGVSLRL